MQIYVPIHTYIHTYNAYPSENAPKMRNTRCVFTIWSFGIVKRCLCALLLVKISNSTTTAIFHFLPITDN